MSVNLSGIVDVVEVSELCALSSKKQLFYYLAEKVQEYSKSKGLGVSADTVIAKLNEREQEGCTSLSNLVAIPHAKIKGLTSSFGILVKLKRPIDFGQFENIPVRIIFAFFAPQCEDNEVNSPKTYFEHQLQKIVRFFRCKENIDQLLNVKTYGEMKELLIENHKVRT